MKEFIYAPQGVCSSKMTFQMDGDVVDGFVIERGCPGNGLGLAQLIKGRKIQEIIKDLEGIPCGVKTTSCPDQISVALKEYATKEGIPL